MLLSDSYYHQTNLHSKLRVDAQGNVMHCETTDNEITTDNDRLNQDSAWRDQGQFGSIYTSRTVDLTSDMNLEKLNSFKGLETISDANDTYDVEFKPVPFLSPSVLPSNKSVTQRFAPPGLAYATMVGFESEDCIVLFGGTTNNNQAPLNDTWVYEISNMRWFRLDTLEIVSDTLKQARRSRGFTGDALPPPRSGHCAVGIRDVEILSTAPSKRFPLDQSTYGESSSRYCQSGDYSLYGHAENEVGNSILFSNRTARSPFISCNDSLNIGLSGFKNGNVNTVNVSGHPTKDPDPWSYRPTMVLFGGANMTTGVTYNDLWIFDVHCRSWREIAAQGNAPTPRWMCTAAALEQRIFIFGGESSSFQILNDLHMYDHVMCAWRELRTVVPCPGPRMGHAATTVGDNMIIVGGMDKASYINQANEITAAAMTQAREIAKKKKRGITSANITLKDIKKRQVSKKNAISDVWCLDMRTLLWRELGILDKKNSPFVWGNPRPSGEDPSKLQNLFPPVREDPDRLSNIPSTLKTSDNNQIKKEIPYSSEDDPSSLSSIEGHVLISFDNHIVMYGGNNAAGKLNTKIFSFDTVTEKWSYHGEIDTTNANTTNKAEAQRRGNDPNDSTFVAIKPQPRTHHCACVLVHKSQPMSLSKFNTIAQPGKEASFHMAEEKETKPLLDYFCFMLAKQVASRGVLTVYKNRPVINHTIIGYFFGGTSFPRNVSDLWSVSLSIQTRKESSRTSERSISSLSNQEANNNKIEDLMYRASRAGVVSFDKDILSPSAREKGRRGRGHHASSSAKEGVTAFSEEGTYARSQRPPVPTFYFPSLDDSDKKTDTLKASSFDNFITHNLNKSRSVRSKDGKISRSVSVKDETVKLACEQIEEVYKQERIYEKMVSLSEEVLDEAHKFILGLPPDCPKKPSGPSPKETDSSKRLKERAQSYISIEIPTFTNWRSERRNRKP